jgi:hypothetical protein
MAQGDGEDRAADFFEPAIQDTEPQRSLLMFLRTLTATYAPLVHRTHAEEMALGALVLANGIEVRSDGNARLTVSGLRWQEQLRAGELVDPVRARGLVLTFVWQAYLAGKAEQDHATSRPSGNGATVVGTAVNVETSIHIPLRPEIHINVPPAPPPVVQAPVPAEKAKAIQPDPTRPAVDWRTVQKLLEEWRAKGGPFTTFRDMAERCNCAPATVQKAIRGSPQLREWAGAHRAKKHRKPRFVDLRKDFGHAIHDEKDRFSEVDVRLDEEIASRREKEQAVWAQLLDKATGDERVRLNAMSEEEAQKLISLIMDDPDRS